MIKHEVHLNAFAYLPEYGQSDCPSIFMDVAMWEHRAFDSEVFRCGKIY
jgi:hypothetical protein